jgi:hypothetical protein
MSRADCMYSVDDLPVLLLLNQVVDTDRTSVTCKYVRKLISRKDTSTLRMVQVEARAHGGGGEQSFQTCS